MNIDKKNDKDEALKKDFRTGQYIYIAIYVQKYSSIYLTPIDDYYLLVFNSTICSPALCNPNYADFIITIIICFLFSLFRCLIVCLYITI